MALSPTVPTATVTSWLQDLLLPRTDAGVAVQGVLLLAVIAAGLWLSRADRDRRLLVAGIGLVLLGAAALRALH